MHKADNAGATQNGFSTTTRLSMYDGHQRLLHLRIGLNVLQYLIGRCPIGSGRIVVE